MVVLVFQTLITSFTCGKGPNNKREKKQKTKNKKQKKQKQKLKELKNTKSTRTEQEDDNNGRQKKLTKFRLKDFISEWSIYIYIYIFLGWSLFFFKVYKS